MRLPELVCHDPWILHGGGPDHANLEGARRAWATHPEWMDYLDPAAPNHAEKLAERAIYVDAWREWIGAARVLDVGCGIGRLATVFLDAGAAVWGVDADPEALRRCIGHARGRSGTFTPWWSTPRVLPKVEVDVIVACELLCYVEDAAEALRAIAQRLRPGGVLLASVEARWGWAAADDAAPGTIEAALGGDGTVHVPGDRWVRTYEREAFRTLLEDGGFSVDSLQPTHYGPGGPLARVVGGATDLSAVLAHEARCRTHPVWRPLNRAWAAVGTRC